MSFADGDILLKKDGSNAKIHVGSNSNKRIEIFGSHAQGIYAVVKILSSLTEGFWIANNSEILNSMLVMVQVYKICF